ncbi:signal peptide-containing protein, YSIRK family, partial [Streptococcus equinus]
MKKKFIIKKSLEEGHCEKKYRYSIRKLNVGVASVAIAAFMILGGGVRAVADSVTDATSSDQVAIIESEPSEAVQSELSDSSSNADSNEDAAYGNSLSSEAEKSISESNQAVTTRTNETTDFSQLTEDVSQVTPEEVTIDATEVPEDETSKSDAIVEDSKVSEIAGTETLVKTSTLRTNGESGSDTESKAKTDFNAPQAEDGKDTVSSEDVPVDKEWTINENPNNKDEAEALAKIKQQIVGPSVTLEYVSDADKAKFDTSKIEIDTNQNRLTYGVLWLGQPEDGEDDQATGDYNERNNTGYYIVLSRDTESYTLYFTLKNINNLGWQEQKVYSIGSAGSITFDTLTEAVNSDRDNANYSIDISEGSVTVRNIKSNSKNYNVYLLNLLSQTTVGTAVSSGNFNIPKLTEQTNNYYVVDYSTYQAWLEANKNNMSESDYISYKSLSTDKFADGIVTNERLLALLKQIGYSGNVFEASGKLDYDKYELIESPYDNQNKINTYLVDDYTVGDRSQNNSGSNQIKRIKEVISEDGSVAIEVWILDITQPNAKDDFDQGRSADKSLVLESDLKEHSFKLLYRTEAIAPGEFNNEFFSLDFKSDDFNKLMATIEKNNANGVSDDTLEELRNIVESSGGTQTGNRVVGNVGNQTTYSDRWAYTRPASTGKTYGALAVPLLVSANESYTSSTGEVVTVPSRIGGMNVQLANDNAYNYQHVNWYYVEKGSVAVHYEDTDGNVIADSVSAVDHGESNSIYDTSTASLKPSKITTPDGTVYYLVTQNNGVKQILTADSVVDNMLETYTFAETGNVEAMTNKNITYVYQKAGDVVIRYHSVDNQGNVLGLISGDTSGITKASVSIEEVDSNDLEPGTSYSTIDLRPETITTSDGTVYRLVTSDTNPHAYTDGVLSDTDDKNIFISGGETGSITSGKTAVINYYYEAVKGDVVVHYKAVDSEGNDISISADVV